MLRAAVASLIFGLPLMGCAVANDAADMIARDRAKTVVNQIVAERLPGVNAAPVTDCIIDNASAAEITSVARASVIGVTENTVNTVVDVAQRPDTVSCIARNGLTLLRL